jgi:hypothetical protein
MSPLGHRHRHRIILLLRTGYKNSKPRQASPATNANGIREQPYRYQ